MPRSQIELADPAPREIVKRVAAARAAVTLVGETINFRALAAYTEASILPPGLIDQVEKGASLAPK